MNWERKRCILDVLYVAILFIGKWMVLELYSKGKKVYLSLERQMPNMFSYMHDLNKDRKGGLFVM